MLEQHGIREGVGDRADDPDMRYTPTRRAMYTGGGAWRAFAVWVWPLSRLGLLADLGMGSTRPAGPTVDLGSVLARRRLLGRFSECTRPCLMRSMARAEMSEFSE